MRGVSGVNGWAVLILIACQLLTAHGSSRQEVQLYPGPGWQYSDTGNRDINAPPAGGWSATELQWPNLYWQKISFPFKDEWRGQRVVLRIGACAYGATVYVNGQRVGSSQAPVTPYDVDITDYLQASGDNLLVLGLEDWTTFLGSVVPLSNNRIQHDQIPESSLQGPIGYAPWLFQKKLWTNDIRLLIVPATRIADVFVKPSVRKGSLAVELTVRNDTSAARTVAVGNQVVNWKDGSAQRIFATVYVDLPAQSATTVEVTVPWPNPRLWSPADPHLYKLITTITAGERALDTLSTRFGFREFWIETAKDGRRSWYVLNGVRQNLRGEGLWHPNLGVEYFRTYVRWLLDNNFNILRLCNGGLPEYYRIADEEGLLIQSEVPFNFNHRYDFSPLFWQRAEQMLLAQVRTYRNHPSVVFWGVENEVMLTSPGQEIGPALLELQRAALKMDPTRVVMHEGDGDLRTVREGKPSPGLDVQTINIHDYVVETGRTGGVLSVMDFPNAAYAFGKATTAKELPGYSFGTVLPDKSKPWFIGEFGPAVVFNNPHGLAFLGGDETYVDLFGDARGLMEANGLYYGFQIDGYRYFDHICGIAPWGLYYGDPSIASGAVVREFFKPVTVRVKEWTRTVFAGDRVSRTLTIYNDDVTESSRFVLKWKLLDGPTELRSGSLSFTAEPGFSSRQNLVFVAPSVSQRMDGQLVLVLERNGERVDTVSRDVSVFPRRAPMTVPRGLRLLLYEPDGALVASALKATGVAYDRISDIDLRRQPAGLLIMGRASYNKDTPAATIGAIRQWIEDGGTVLVTGGQWSHPPWLSQHNDTDYAAEPFWVRSTIGFVRAPFHSLLKNLAADDFTWWADDHYLVGDEGNFTKPSSGLATVLVDTGGRNLGIGDAPLVEFPHGRGVTVVNQLALFEKIDQEPVARVLFQNILDYAAAALQRPTAKGIGVLAGSSTEITDVLGRMNVPHSIIDGQLSRYTPTALGDTFSTLIVANEDSAWKEVAAHRGMLRSFAANGGSIILRRIEPARAADASALTGVPMTVRGSELKHPQLEKAVSHPLLDGISNDDVFWVIPTGYRNQSWASAIVDDVILVAERPGVTGLLTEPSRTGTLQADSGQSYNIGVANLDSGEVIEDPGFGLVCIQPDGVKGAILIDQLRWDQPMDPAFNRKAQRYLSALLANCRRQSIAP